jgi:ubiquinone/menaquinone biosynthesis C-methylase UbiE
MMAPLGPAAMAFDAVATGFDTRFGTWASVAAQRRAVRAELLREFPPGGRILELGGGTGEDAAFLASHGFQLVLTDPAPRMVAIAGAKLAPWGARAELAAADDLESLALRHGPAGEELFDGAFSNFAPLNCVADPSRVARGLSRLLKPDAAAMIVTFGTFCPGEMVAEIARGRPEQAFRRFRRGPVPARLGAREFTVFYHRRASLQRAFSPWFVLEKRIGIGVTVPPSAAEPWISEHLRLLGLMERFDAVAGGALAALGDHVLYVFRRTAAE